MEYKDVKNRRPKILRPIAWMLICLSVWVLPLVGELVCNLGSFLVNYLNQLSTVAVVILVILFGSIYLSLFGYSAILLSSLFVTVSNWVYPTRKAIRYYFIGIYLILSCVVFILSGILGFISGGEMFWFYARFVWLAFASIMLILYGVEAKQPIDTRDNDCHKETKNQNAAHTSELSSHPMQQQRPMFSEFIKTKRSSYIEAVYHKNTNLYVKLRNSGLYLHQNLPRDVYLLMMNDASMGTFYKKYIAPNYPSVVCVVLNEKIKVLPKDAVIAEPFIPLCKLKTYARDKDGNLILKNQYGDEYCYYDVPLYLYNEMKQSNNVAAFIKNYIQGSFVCEKIE